MIVGAIWLLLHFTAPADPPGVRCARYVVEGRDALGVTWLPVVRSSPGLDPVVWPRTPGVQDSVWISLSQDRQIRRFRLAAADAAGNRAAWSNPVYAVAGIRDTIWWHGGHPAPWHSGIVSWSRPPADTSDFSPIRHQEAVTLDARIPLCRTYGYIARRGARDSAPCAQP